MASPIPEIVENISEEDARRGYSARLAQRGISETLGRRAAFLAPEDAALVRGVYEAGMSSVELARLMNLRPQTVRARLRRLLRHLDSGLFLFVLRHRGDWMRERRQVAELRVLQRRSLREAVRRSGLSLHQVRRHDDAIRAQFEAEQP